MRSRGGFTLVELLIALVISGILVTVLFSVMQGQGRFAEVQTAQEEVRGNARSALEVITSDIRGVGYNGIYLAQANQIGLRVPRAWGVVCGFNSNGDLVVLFPPHALPMPPGPDSLAAPDPTDPNQTGYLFFQVSDNTVATMSSEIALCTSSLNPTPAIVATTDPELSQVRRYAGVTVAPEARARVYVYDAITYAAQTDPTDASGQLSGRWIVRNGTPLAGPIGSSGLRFTYLDRNGATTSTVDAIRSVKVRVVTESRTEFNQEPQVSRDSVTVYLRNRT